MADARTRVVPLFDPQTQEQLFPPNLPPKEVDLAPESGMGIKLKGGTLTVPQEDGSIIIDFRPDLTERAEQAEHDQNLAGKIDEGELARISSELLDAIQADDQSRQEWLETRSRGIELLGLKLEEPRADVTGSSAPLEGMTTVRHPLLLEAVLRFQAMARGELLPATGPVKVRNDMPPNPDIPAPALGQSMQYTDDVASAFESDFNHYLTVDAPEYYPDTDRMLFQIGFGGLGIKKVYNCPLRRRPVSESIDAKDFIVSNAATDLTNSGRVTHRIMMRPSTLKRMQIVGAYRDVEIRSSTITDQNEVDKTIAEIQGTTTNPLHKPDDTDQEIYECYCELDISGYEHKDEDGKVTGLRVPYKVTIHKESREILEIRRNWKEDDDLCLPREVFVDFQFVPGLGFYPIGLLHILGNATKALTAAWREMLDAGMFASFPGFIYNKSIGRQLTNQFRVPPGGGVGVDAGMQRLSDAIMPLPYKEPGAAMINFIQRIEELAQRLGGTAELNIGEGKQEAPVGTTLALIEQATKSMDAVHKRLHASQQREFNLLKERFKEDPEAFWRHNKKSKLQWHTDLFMSALNAYEVVPVSDPNNPTSLHRIAKAAALGDMAKAAPQLFDQMAVAKRVLRIAGIDAEGLFLTQPIPPPPDPRLEAVKVKAAGQAQQASAQAKLADVKAAQVISQAQAKARDTEAKERIAFAQAQIKQRDAATELQAKMHEAAFAADRQRQEMAQKRQEHMDKLRQSDQMHRQKMMQAQQKMAMAQRQQAQKAQMDQRQQTMKAGMEMQKQSQQIQSEQQMEQFRQGIEQQRLESGLAAEQKGHEQKLRQGDESHRANLEQKKQLAKVKPAKTSVPSSKPKPKKSGD